VWTQKTFFTLEQPEEWGYREKLLEKANFLILPANENGLTTLVEQINAGTWQRPYPKKATEDFTAFPTYFNDFSHWWLERHAPDRAKVTELLKQVRDFLGDEGYYWFSACAVYPELRWQLTLFLGYQLKSLTEERLAKLARLPWFRYGYMPNWLRKQLIKDLSLPQEREIRTVLYNLFLLDKPLSDFSLKIAQKDTLSALVQRLLPMWAKKAPKNIPLHEDVFMTQPPESTVKKLSTLNPLDYLRLLWWVLVMPQQLIDYREEFGEKDDRRVGKWLASTLLWLPLLMPSFALGLEWLSHSHNAWLPETYLWFSAGFVGCWLLLVMLGNLNYMWAFGVMFGVAFSVAFVVAGVVAVVVAVVVALSVANGVANGVAISVAFGVAGYMAGGVAIVVAISVAFGVAIAVGFDVAGDIVGDVAFVMAFVATLVVAFGVALSVANGVANGVAISVAFGVALVGGIGVGIGVAFGALLVEKSLKTGIPSWFARFAFLLLLAAYLFLIIYCFFGGWQLFVEPPRFYK